MLSGDFSVLGLCHIVGLHKDRSLTNRLSNFLPFFRVCIKDTDSSMWIKRPHWTTMHGQPYIKTLIAAHLVQILVVTTSLSLVGSRTPGIGHLDWGSSMLSTNFCPIFPRRVVILYLPIYGWVFNLIFLMRWEKFALLSARQCCIFKSKCDTPCDQWRLLWRDINSVYLACVLANEELSGIGKLMRFYPEPGRSKFVDGKFRRNYTVACPRKPDHILHHWRYT